MRRRKQTSSDVVVDALNGGNVEIVRRIRGKNFEWGIGCIEK